jgi:hypothetical protein
MFPFSIIGNNSASTTANSQRKELTLSEGQTVTFPAGTNIDRIIVKSTSDNIGAEVSSDRHSTPVQIGTGPGTTEVFDVQLYSEYPITLLFYHITDTINVIILTR